MKSFFTNQGAFSAVYLVLGILLLIHPVAFSRAVCYVLGICAFVYGAWKIWGYWKDRKLGGVFQLELIVGVILVVIGLVALFKSEVLLSILPVIIGLIILMDGLVTINQALNLRKLDYRWKYTTLFRSHGHCGSRVRPGSGSESLRKRDASHAFPGLHTAGGRLLRLLVVLQTEKTV